MCHCLWLHQILTEGWRWLGANTARVVGWLTTNNSGPVVKERQSQTLSLCTYSSAVGGASHAVCGTQGLVNSEVYSMTAYGDDSFRLHVAWLET